MLIYFRLHVVNFGVPAKKSQTEQLAGDCPILSSADTLGKSWWATFTIKSPELTPQIVPAQEIHPAIH